MKVHEKLKEMSIDDFAEWLDSCGLFEDSPWLNWWNEKYCNKCESEFVYSDFFKKRVECAWCEVKGKCKFFPDLPDIPPSKEIVKLWLESET